MCVHAVKAGVEDMIRTTVAVRGFSSEVGKTTLVCEVARGRR